MFRASRRKQFYGIRHLFQPLVHFEKGRRIAKQHTAVSEGREEDWAPRVPWGADRVRVSETAFLPQNFSLHTCREPTFEEPFRDLAPHSLRCEAGAGCEGGSSAHISSGSLHRAHRGLLGMGVRKGHLAKRPVFLCCW